MLAAVEGPPGTWRIVEPHGREYGLIGIRRVEGGLFAYRAEGNGVVLRWATSLRLACLKVHRHMLEGLAPGGGPAWDRASSPALGAGRPPRVSSRARGRPD